jgi:hypothetical protein
VTTNPLKTPSPDVVRQYIDLFDADPSSGASDRALARLFALLPDNTSLDEVLLKVATLNSLYNTNIFSVVAVAQHIVSLGIDARIAEGSPEIVEEVAVVKLGARRRRNYSFATKYCSWHAPRHYPIYDSLVDRLLWTYKQTAGFRDFTRQDLQRYPTFREVIDAFRTHFGLSEFSYKELDRFLWKHAREVFIDAD